MTRAQGLRLLVAVGILAIACRNGSDIPPSAASDANPRSASRSPPELVSAVPATPAIPLTPATPKPVDVRRLDTTKDLHSIIATRSDGSRFTVYRNRRQSFSFTSDNCTFGCSKDLNWAIISWTDPDMIAGSLGGSIETRMGLLAVRQKALLDETDLGFDRASLIAVSVDDGREVLVVNVHENGRYRSRNIPLDELDDLIKRSAKRPLGTPSDRVDPSLDRR